MLLPLGREAAYLAFEGLEVRVLDSVCLEVLTLGRSCKTTNTAELRNTGESFTLHPSAVPAHKMPAVMAGKQGEGNGR